MGGGLRVIYTQSDMLTVWRMLNDTCFGSLLEEPVFTNGAAEFSDPVFGVYYPVGLYHGNAKPVIHIDQRCTTVSMLLSTMAHEMIHQWQDVNNKPVNHGNQFRSMAALVKRRTGLVC